MFRRRTTWRMEGFDELNHSSRRDRCWPRPHADHHPVLGANRGEPDRQRWPGEHWRGGTCALGACLGKTGAPCTGTENTAFGYGALHDNTTGFNNTASGASALGGNTTGVDNTASGSQALL